MSRMLCITGRTAVIDMTPIMINEMKIVESMLEANGFATLVRIVK